MAELSMEVHVRALQLFPTQWDPFDKVIPVSPFPFRFINYVSYNESEKRQIIRVLHTYITFFPLAFRWNSVESYKVNQQDLFPIRHR